MKNVGGKLVKLFLEKSMTSVFISFGILSGISLILYPESFIEIVFNPYKNIGACSIGFSSKLSSGTDILTKESGRRLTWFLAILKDFRFFKFSNLSGIYSMLFLSKSKVTRVLIFNRQGFIAVNLFEEIVNFVSLSTFSI